MRIGREWIPYAGDAHFNLITGDALCDSFAEKLEDVFGKRFEGRPFYIEDYGTSLHPRLWVTAKQAERLADLYILPKRNRLWKLGKDKHYSGVLKAKTAYGVKCSVMVPGISKETGEKIYFKVSHTYYHVSQLWGIPNEVLARIYGITASTRTLNSPAPESVTASDPMEDILAWTGLDKTEIEELIALERLYKQI